MKKMTSLMILAGLIFGQMSLVAPVEVRAAAVEAKAADLINLNKASFEELQMVRGIGPAIAQRILDHRKANGNFKTADELADIKGIGTAKLEKIKQQVVV